jgi:hypothetical protein
MTSDEEKIKLHFKYVALILVMSIILIATDRWTVQKDFTAYLSNAATMTSLLLGLVAIFYSFVSNDSLSRSLGSITTVSAEVKETKDQITRYVEVTKETADAGANSAQTLQKAAGDVAIGLINLEGTLKAISEQNQTLQSLVSNLPVRMEKLEISFVEVAKVLGEKPTLPATPVRQNDISIQVIDEFLARPSLSYNLFTYACVLAASHKKQLSIKEICKVIDIHLPSSFNGFMVAMQAIQLLNRKAVDNPDNDRIYLISNVHPYLSEKVRSYYLGYVDATFTDNIANKDLYLKKCADLEAHFLSN